MGILKTLTINGVTYKVATPVPVTNVTLLASAWEGSGNRYSQVVSVNGVTGNSKVNLTTSVEQIEIFYEKDITFITENDGGVVTVHVIGQKPENDYTLQADLVEVAEHTGTKIYGSLVTTPINPEKIGSTEGGAKAFYVNVTAAGETYTADKTLEEIEAAYQAGSPLYCYCTSPVDGITYCLPLGARLYDGTVFCFGNASVQGVMTVVINPARVSVEADTIPTKKDLENVGKPTDEQVNTAVNSYLTDHPVSGLSSAEKTRLLLLLKNAVFTADMSGTIAQLETLWSKTPDAPEVGVEQIGSVLSIVSGVTVSQSGSVLDIV